MITTLSYLTTVEVFLWCTQFLVSPLAHTPGEVEWHFKNNTATGACRGSGWFLMISASIISAAVDNSVTPLIFFPISYLVISEVVRLILMQYRYF